MTPLGLLRRARDRPETRKQLDSIPRPPGLPATGPIRMPTPQALKERLDRGGALCGAPEEIIPVRRPWEATGVDQIMFSPVTRAMDQKHVLRSIETIGKHVLPAFDADPITTPRAFARSRSQAAPPEPERFAPQFEHWRARCKENYGTLTLPGSRLARPGDRFAGKSALSRVQVREGMHDPAERELVRSDPDLAVRAEAIERLADVGCDDLAPLIAIVEAPLEPELRRRAAALLAEHARGNPRIRFAISHVERDLRR